MFWENIVGVLMRISESVLGSRIVVVIESGFYVLKGISWLR